MSARGQAVTAVQLSGRPIVLSPGWTRYVEAPGSAEVRPVRVLQVHGEVTDPTALVKAAGTATMTYPVGGAPPSLVVDYGKDVGGIPTFSASADATASIRVSYSETLANLGHDGALTVGVFKSGDPQRTVTLPVTHGGVQAPDLVQGGERYERISLTTPGQVRLRRVGIRFTGVRGTPSTLSGHFLSSDGLLNRIWYAGVYTLNLDQISPGTPFGTGVVSRQHLIVDGAKRDRAVWSGDQLVADLTDYYASDPAYVRDSLALLLDHPASVAGEFVPTTGTLAQPGPLAGVCSPNPAVAGPCFTWSATYSMAPVIALEDYYLYTGDLSFVRAHWPAVTRQMAWDAEQVGPGGLLAVTQGDASDWNLEHVSGALTYVNALYVETLRSSAQMAGALGHRAEAATWNARASAVAAAVNAQLWDPGAGVYRPSTTERNGVVQDANVMAVLAGIPGPRRSASVLHVLARSLRSRYGALSVASPAPPGYTQIVSPYMGSLNLRADFLVGEGKTALALMRTEWGYMVSHDPGGVDWERIELNGVPAGGTFADSSAHAWSTGPTADLSQYVLGVSPASPGYSRWSVAPAVGGLRWAQGTVPTPHGPISVAWWQTQRSFALTVDAPRGTSGSVAIPLAGSNRTIARNGKVVWTDGRPVPGVSAHRIPGAVVLVQEPGTATYAWSS